MSARADFEAQCWGALTKYKTAVAEGTYQKTADNNLIDAILKAGDVYALGAAMARRRQAITSRQLDEALARVVAGA